MRRALVIVAAALGLGRAPAEAQLRASPHLQPAPPESPGRPTFTTQAAVGAERGSASRTLHDLGRGLGNLAGDGWYVITAPTRMDGDDAWVLAGVLGVGGLFYVWDGGMADALRRQDGEWLHDALLDAGDAFEPLGFQGNTNVWYALGVAVGYFSGWDPLLEISRDLLASNWIASATYNPPRVLIGRRRPDEGDGPRSFGGGTSLPSGHSATITSMAVVVSHHLRWKPATVAVWGVAGTVMLQRVDSGKHWPSDVWLGAAWGYGVSRLVLARADARRGVGPAERRAARLSIQPFVDVSSGRPGVAVRVPVGGG